jgi:hypothetical protein
MFKCDCCHTEYGGIRGVVAPKCPRCAPRATDSSGLRGGSGRFFRVIDSRPLGSAERLRSMQPLTGEIALLDRAYRA